jgi:hypothetical protein
MAESTIPPADTAIPLHDAEKRWWQQHVYPHGKVYGRARFALFYDGFDGCLFPFWWPIWAVTSTIYGVARFVRV